MLFTRRAPPVPCSNMRYQRRRGINPEVGPRIAAFGRTKQFVSMTDQAADFHLATCESSFADNAKALVIERTPLSDSIFRTKDREPIFEIDMRAHNGSSLLAPLKRTIGTVDDWPVG